MDDLISRQAAIDAYGDWYVEEGTAEGFIGTVKQLLEGLPSADPGRDEWCTECKEYDQERHCCPRFNRVIRKTFEEAENNQWIPISQRLPEECEEVNITWVNTDPAPYYQGIKNKPFTGSGVYRRGRWYWYSSTCKDYCEEYGFSASDEMDDAIKVTAWRRFPEPYQEEIEE